MYDVSVDGTLIYGSPPGGDPQSVDDRGVVWVGMNGAETYIPIDPVPEGAQSPRADPSGGRIAYQSDGQIWRVTMCRMNCQNGWAIQMIVGSRESLNGVTDALPG